MKHFYFKICNYNKWDKIYKIILGLHIEKWFQWYKNNYTNSLKTFQRKKLIKKQKKKKLLLAFRHENTLNLGSIA